MPLGINMIQTSSGKMRNYLWLSFMYLVLTRILCESYRRRFGSLLLDSCNVFRVLIINCLSLLIVAER